MSKGESGGRGGEGQAVGEMESGTEVKETSQTCGVHDVIGCWGGERNTGGGTLLKLPTPLAAAAAKPLRTPTGRTACGVRGRAVG